WNSAEPALGTHTPSGTKVRVRYLSVPTYWEVQAPAVSSSAVAFSGETRQRGALHVPIYLTSIRRWSPLHLLNSPADFVYSMALSDEWLVWVGMTDGKMGYNGQWELYAYDLKTGRRYTIDGWRRRGLTPAGFDPPHVSVSGSTVAWSYVDCTAHCRPSRHPPRVRSAILVKALPFGRQRILRRLLSTCEQIVALPSISGHIVVWDQGGEDWCACRVLQCKARIRGAIALDSLATGKQRIVTRSDGAFDPVTNGRYVAWEQWPAGVTRSDYGAIILLNLRTGHKDGGEPKTAMAKRIGLLC
ncbi:MAG TPA: hypothetical protein VG815_11835, partial [Chloroflexota bacterium]|nr:hypothetical protein [Chloroflexota bacterium]